MKNLIYFFALFFAVIYAASCDTKTDGPDVYTNPPLKDTISEAKFNLWVANWEAAGKSFIANEDSLLRYFTMPLIDLEEFLNHPGNGPDTIAAARFVIGMEFDRSDSIPHLMLLGADSSGKNMTDTSKQQYIYDVTKPCPKMCGLNSLPDKK